MNLDKNEIDCLVVQESWRALDAFNKLDRSTCVGVQEDLFGVVQTKLASIFTHDCNIGLEARQKIVQGVIERTPFTDMVFHRMRDHFTKVHSFHTTQLVQSILSNSEKADVWIRSSDTRFLNETKFYIGSWMPEFLKYTALEVLLKLSRANYTYEKSKHHIETTQGQLQRILTRVRECCRDSFIVEIENAFTELSDHPSFNKMVEAIYTNDREFFNEDYDYEEYGDTINYENIYRLFCETLSADTQRHLSLMQSEAQTLWNNYERKPQLMKAWATEIQTMCVRLMVQVSGEENILS